MARAATEGHLSIVKLLAAAGIDTDFCDSDGFTPICGAALAGHIEIVRYLEGVGTRKDGAGPYGEIPLCLAAGRGNIEMMNVLLELGVKVLFELGGPLTPPVESVTVLALAKAVDKRHYAAAEFLRNRMGLPDIITSGHPGDRNHRMLLVAGAACGSDDLVRQLLEQGCSPDAVSPSVEAFGLIHEANTDFLPAQSLAYFTRLAHPSPLALAAHRGHHQVVELLFRHGAKFHEKPGGGQEPCPLYLDIAGKHRRIVEMLLDHGASPDWRDSNGYPVLFRAAGASDIFELLLDRGADPELRSNDGGSIIARALSSGSIPTVEILRRRNIFKIPASMHTRASQIWFQAAVNGGRTMVEYLLDQGYRVKPNGRLVEDALLWALGHANAPLVNFLFERGVTTGANRFRISILWHLLNRWAGISRLLLTPWTRYLRMELTLREMDLLFMALLARSSTSTLPLQSPITTSSFSSTEVRIRSARMNKAKLRCQSSQVKDGERKSR